MLKKSSLHNSFEKNVEELRSLKLLRLVIENDLLLKNTTSVDINDESDTIAALNTLKL